MAFFDVFLCNPHRPFTAALISVQMEGVEVVHIWAKFYLDMTYLKNLKSKFKLKFRPQVVLIGFYMISDAF